MSPWIRLGECEVVAGRHLESCLTLQSSLLGEVVFPFIYLWVKFTSVIQYCNLAIFFREKPIFQMIINLQCCVSFWCTAKWFNCVCVCVYIYILFHSTAKWFSLYICVCVCVCVQFSLVTQLCPTVCNSMDCIMLGLWVHHQCPEFTETHVHWVGDAIHASHPLSSPSPPTLHLSQHQGLFQWVSSSHQVAKVLELQYQSFQWIFRTDFL